MDSKFTSIKSNGKTIFLCPDCSTLQPGSIFIKDGKIKIKIQCPKHGEHYRTLSNHPEFYRAIRKIVRHNKIIPEYDLNSGIIKTNNQNNIITTIHINLTNRCNLHCKDCFAACDPKKNQNEKEISIEEILSQLIPFNNMKHKPMIVLIGGEPTLREDLPEIIQKLRSKGFNVRLSTNGIRMVNREYVKSLVDAGLQWVLLQFDGFKSSDSIKLRGVDLIKEKMQVIANAQRYGLKIHLIMMIARGVNDGEMLKVIQYSLDQHFIYAVNFYPESQIGRYEDSSYSVFDCLFRLESLSNGSITIKDIIWCKRFWNLLYIFVKSPLLRQKTCTFPIFFYRYKNTIYPINRLFSIQNLFKHPLSTIQQIMKCYQLLSWAEKPTKDFLYFNIEKFFDVNGFDLQEAYNCHNVYLTPQGMIPLCIYNVLYRQLNLSCL